MTSQIESTIKVVQSGRWFAVVFWWKALLPVVINIIFGVIVLGDQSTTGSIIYLKEHFVSPRILTVFAAVVGIIYLLIVFRLYTATSPIALLMWLVVIFGLSLIPMLSYAIVITILFFTEYQSLSRLGLGAWAGMIFALVVLFADMMVIFAWRFRNQVHHETDNIL